MNSRHDTTQSSSSQRAAAERSAATAEPTPAPALLGQRLGNQYLQQLLHARVLQAKLSVSDPDDAFEQEADRVADQVMRMPGPQASVQRKCGDCEQLQRTANAAPATPSVDTATENAIAGLSGRGSALPDAVRTFMEPRFNANFGAVRIHNDAHAHELARAVNAQAFTVGRNVVFGAGHYAPQTQAGRRLLAHELTHVLQQQAGGEQVLRRRAAQAETWAGTFIADPYDAQIAVEGSRTVGFGADIAIKFQPNDRVDAEKIAFVQTALSSKDGTPHNKYSDEAEAKLMGRRSLPAGKVDAGVHVDQLPRHRTPLYGMEADAAASDLASSKPTSLTRFGWHYRDGKGQRQHQDAVMKDQPDLTTGDIYVDANDTLTTEWFQKFETTAVAVSGNQQGIYYGSVEWGWRKRATDTQPVLLDFKVRSNNAPSASFFKAAQLWNSSKAIHGEQTLDLSLDAPLTTSSVTVVWDGPDKRKVIARLPKGTPVGRTTRVDAARSWWSHVVVTGGAHVGKQGWVMEVDLYGSPSP